MNQAVMLSQREEMLKEVLIDVFGDNKDGSIEDIMQVSEWLTIEGGQTLFKQGDVSDEMHLVVSGRLRAQVIDAKGEVKTISELSKGDTIGEMAIIARSPKKVTVECVRDSALVTISLKDMIELSTKYPHLMLRISKIAIERLTTYIENKPEVDNTVTNIMLYPVNREKNISEFSDSLIQALKAYGKVFSLCSRTIIDEFGADFHENKDKEAALIAWLEQKEKDYRYVVYLSDCINEDWHRRAIRQADRILLLADREDDPTPTEGESKLFANSLAKTHLVLTHPDRGCPKMRTEEFVSPRKVTKHYHILKDNNDDIKKVARYINGTANGLVFAGGGARGFAHLGVIKAFKEHDLPIDMLGGTSMGAIMGGAYAVRMEVDSLIDEVRDIFVRQKPLNDYTVPFISIFAGKKLDKLLHNFYQDAQIEDCWTNFFCVAANLSNAGTTVHTKGTLWKAIRSSLSLPGVVPPVNINGELFIDGGIVNNYPVDVMRDFGAGTVVGIDLSEEVNSDPVIDELPDAWSVMKGKFTRKPPQNSGTSIGTILMKSALLSSEHMTKLNIELADFHWGVNASKYGLLKFADFDNIVKVGYDHAIKEIKNMSEEDLYKLKF